MKIYSLDDRIKVRIGDITVSLSPLSFKDKMEIQAMMLKFKTTRDYALLMKGTFRAVQCAVKGLDGVTKPDGTKYKLKFKDGVLTDDCTESILNTETSAQMAAVCQSLLDGIPSDFTDPDTGKPMEGVKIVNPTRGKG